MLNSKQSENSHGARKLFICITKSDWGGAQKYVFDIATNTPRDQFDTTVLVGDGNLKKRLEDARVKTLLLKNAQRDINIKKEFGLLFELIKLFKKEKPDIVHLNSSKMGLIGALAGRIVGIKKIVFTIHGWAFNEDRNFVSKIFIKILHIFTIILCHKAISVSETTKNQSVKLFNKKRKLANTAQDQNPTDALSNQVIIIIQITNYLETPAKMFKQFPVKFPACFTSPNN